MLRVTSWPLRVRLAVLTLLVVVLVSAAAIAAVSLQKAAAKPNGIVGQGGADPFWGQIANKAQTGGAASAIAWADSFEAGHPESGLSVRYDGYCLEFVANAYGASFSSPYNTAWDMARASKLNDPHSPTAAPAGALMFFDLSNHGIPEGHVGISLGGGAMISALEHTPIVQVTPNIQSNSYWSPAYRGWTWPPSRWGPLAAQATASTTGNGGGGKAAAPAVQIEEEFIIRFTPTYGIFLTGFPANASISVDCYDSSRPTGFETFTVQTDGSGSALNVDQCDVTGSHIDHWVVAGGIESNHFTDTNFQNEETAGGVVHTWTNYLNAGGSQGPSIAAYQSVEVTCALTGFKVADGNTWWYRIASRPWNNAYYASADAFYNNGATSGSLHNTPFVDTAVPACAVSIPPPPPPPLPTATPNHPAPPTVTPIIPTVTPTPIPAPSTYAETTGGVAHTWTNYLNAGGYEGPTIAAYQTVQIACALTGFKVADGNTWWYRIASSPWNNAYYVSADAFYNNGATSGSLHGTPFVDPNVPHC